MKRMVLYFICVCMFLCCMPSAGYAAENTCTIYATCRKDGSLYISGNAPNARAGTNISVFIAKPGGAGLSPMELMQNQKNMVEAIGQTKVLSDGSYSYSHKLGNAAVGGEYTVTVGLNGAISSIADRTCTVLYEPNSDLCINMFALGSGRIIVNGYTMEQGNLALTVKTPDGQILRQESVEPESDGRFLCSYPLDEHAPNGIYSVEVTSYNGSLTECVSQKYIRGEAHPIKIFVANFGGEGGCGSEKNPFETIEQALKFVSNIKDAGEDVTIYLRGGTYRLKSALEITPQQALEDGKTLTVKSYPQEHAVISGGVKVSDWHEGENGIWYSDVELSDFRELYVNQTPAIRARSEQKYSALGWYNSSGKSYTDKTNYPSKTDYPMVAPGQIHTSNLPTSDGSTFAPKGFRGGLVLPSALKGMSEWNNVEDIELVRNKMWLHNRMKADSVIKADGSVVGLSQEETVLLLNKETSYSSTDYQPSYPWKYDDLFYLENALELLDEPNEWYYDKKAKRLYYMPADGMDIRKVEVEVPQLETLVSVLGTADEDVSEICFENVEFSCATWNMASKFGYAALQAGCLITQGANESTVPAAVKINYADNVKVKDCTVKNVGAAGIGMEQGAKNALITDCEIYNIGASGISVGNQNQAYIDKTGEKLCENNKIHNNLIHDCSQQYTGNIGILAFFTAGLEISNNEIYNLPYSGISLGWGWDAYRDSVTCHDNLVKGNRIYEIMQVMDWDGGAIYTQGNQPGTKIIDNYCSIDHFVYAGMYLDQGSAYMTIENNVIEATDEVINKTVQNYGAGTTRYVWINLLGTRENTVRNNYTNCRRYAISASDDTQCYENNSDQFDAVAEKIKASSGRSGISIGTVELIENIGTSSQMLFPSGRDANISAVCKIRNYDSADRYFKLYAADFEENILRGCTVATVNLQKKSKEYYSFSLNDIRFAKNDNTQNLMKFFFWNENLSPVKKVESLSH